MQVYTIVCYNTISKYYTIPEIRFGTNFIGNDGVSVCDVNVTQLIVFGGSSNGFGLPGMD